MAKISSRKYYYYRRPIGDPTNTEIPDRKPIWNLYMPDWRPTWLIGDRHAHRRPTCPSETDMPRPIGDKWESNRNLNSCIFKFAYFYLRLLIYIYWNNVRTLIMHFGLRWSMCVSDGACRSLRSGMLISDWSPSSDIAWWCLRSGMSLSNGFTTRHVCLWWVIDRS